MSQTRNTISNTSDAYVVLHGKKHVYLSPNSRKVLNGGMSIMEEAYLLSLRSIEEFGTKELRKLLSIPKKNQLKSGSSYTYYLKDRKDINYKNALAEINWLNHRNLLRTVAIKIPKKEYRKNQELKDRFRHEASVNIKRPRIVEIIESFEIPIHKRENPINHIVMEFIEGDSLKNVIYHHNRIFSENEALLISREIAIGVKDIHDAGYYHRDIKSSNIMLINHNVDFAKNKPRIKIIDFGISKSEKNLNYLTKVGTFLGTPSSSSPEQLVMLDPKAPTDIWGIGLIMFEMVTGKLPFGNKDTDSEVLRRRILKLPTPEIQNCSKAYNSIVKKCTEKEENKRYPSADVLITDIERLIEPQSMNSKWIMMAVFALLVFLLILISLNQMS